MIGVLCRENIAEVNFVDLSRLDIGDSFQGSCEGLARLNACSGCEKYYILWRESLAELRFDLQVT